MVDRDRVIGVRMPEGVRARLERRAKAERRTMSSMALVLIEHGLEKVGESH